jgi:hypothetical protein
LGRLGKLLLTRTRRFFKKLEHQLPARELGVAADDDGAGLGKAFAW